MVVRWTKLTATAEAATHEPTLSDVSHNLQTQFLIKKSMSEPLCSSYFIILENL